MKDEVDAGICTNVLQDNFEAINCAFKEGIARSPGTYPEISANCFIDTILDNQKDYSREQQLPRAFVENCYIRATRGDGAKGLGGKLCRGEFLDCVLRLCVSVYPKETNLS